MRTQTQKSERGRERGREGRQHRGPVSVSDSVTTIVPLDSELYCEIFVKMNTSV